MSTCSRSVEWTSTPTSPASYSASFVPIWKPNLKRAHPRKHQHLFFPVKWRLGKSICQTSHGWTAKRLPVTVVFHLCQINECLCTLLGLMVCLFEVAEAAHRENVYFSWANLASLESSGQMCLCCIQTQWNFFQMMFIGNHKEEPNSSKHRWKLKSLYKQTNLQTRNELSSNLQGQIQNQPTKSMWKMNPGNGSRCGWLTWLEPVRKTGSDVIWQEDNKIKTTVSPSDWEGWRVSARELDRKSPSFYFFVYCIVHYQLSSLQ